MTKRRKIPKPTFAPEEAERDNHRVALSDLALGVTDLAHAVSNALVAHNSGVTLEGYPGAIAEAATRVHELASHVVDLKPVVERVWIVDTVPSTIGAVYANERTCREVLRDHWLGSEAVGIANHWLAVLDAWNGESDVIIGPHRVRVRTVQL